MYGAKRRAVRKNYKSIWEHGGYLTVKSKETSRMSCKKGAAIFVINEVCTVSTYEFSLPPPPIPFLSLSNLFIYIYIYIYTRKLKKNKKKIKKQTEEDKNVSYAQVADIAREIALTCLDVYSKINGELRDKKEGFVVLISKADCGH